MQAPAAATIVASYAQGRFDEAQAALIRVSDYAAFQHDADAALTTVHPAVAEALLLEASQAAFNTHHAQQAHLAGAIEEFRTRYVLRYTPTGVAHDGWHDLSVRVKGKKYDVRARKGYAVGLPLN